MEQVEWESPMSTVTYLRWDSMSVFPNQDVGFLPATDPSASKARMLLLVFLNSLWRMWMR